MPYLREYIVLAAFFCPGIGDQGNYVRITSSHCCSPFLLALREGMYPRSHHSGETARTCKGFSDSDLYVLLPLGTLFLVGWS